MSSRAIEFFEIDLPYCQLTYGVSPCQASLVSSPPTGTAKCFQTFPTCQDTANIDLATQTIRFAKPTNYLPRDIDHLPWIESIDYSPSTVSLGENLGVRASLKVKLSDHQHSDAGPGLDKYHAERGYNPYERGSFWPRFRARYLSLQGVVCRWRIGFVGDAIEDYETRQFFIESFEGPDGDGSFTITAKDALKFLDGDRAQAPLLSSGSLLAGIDDNDLSFSLSPTGIGNTEYPPAVGSSPADDYYVCIGGSEIVKVTVRAGDAFTIERAQLGTTAKSHTAGDRVQLVLHYSAQSPADIANDVLTGYTDLPDSYIPLSEWQAEIDANLPSVYTFTYVEPTNVSTIMNRLIEQAGLAMYDDAIAQKLRMKVIKAVPITAQTVSEENVLNKTFDPVEQPDKRATRCWVYYALNDPTKRFDDIDNYRSVAKSEALDIEAIYGQPSIRKIYATGIPAGGEAVAQRIADIVTGRFRIAPRRIKFSKFRGTVAPNLGEGCQIDWRSLQDASGARSPVPAQVIQVKPSATAQQIVAEEMLFTASADDNTRTVTFSFSTNNVNLRDLYDALYSEPEVGDVVKAIINADVIIGSSSVSSPAFDVGDWPVGVVPIIDIRGRIQGAGGRGGRGGNRTSGGLNGQNGGVALYTRADIELLISTGEIWGGGAGSGGGGSAVAGDKCVSGGGGGPGQGQVPGTPGGSGGEDFPGNNAGSATPEAPGNGGAGASYLGTVFSGNGRPGGGKGQNGLTGVAASGGDVNWPPGTGGTAGAAIDGVSFLTITEGPGDIAGPQIN